MPFYDTFSELIHAGTAYLPKLTAALVVFLLGLAFAWAVRWFLARILRPLEKKQASSDPVLRGAYPALLILPNLIFWLLIVLFFASACEVLGLTLVAGWIDRLVVFLPRLLFGVVIVLAGWFGGAWLRKWIIRTFDRMQLAYSETFGNLLRAATILFAVVVAVDQVGVNLDFLTGTLEIILAAFLLAAALAFGLGARLSVENIMGLHYLRQNCQIGDLITIGPWSGVVSDFFTTGVELETAKGRVVVPGRHCSREVVQFGESSNE